LKWVQPGAARFVERPRCVRSDRASGDAGVELDQSLCPTVMDDLYDVLVLSQRQHVTMMISYRQAHWVLTIEQWHRIEGDRDLAVSIERRKAFAGDICVDCIHGLTA
jgi:hypothetical protein